ncbi:hypothetical protein V2J09_007880 [Rumex salicifolius]
MAHFKSTEASTKLQMAPSKKSKSGGKRVAVLHDVSPSKDVKILKKLKKKKPKLVDILGPQWSKQELDRFYQGFRKYGNDWKKVATIVRNRSSEMVEALYNMNRAYLSLPEGTASVVGLIAMMTDHYNNLDGNGSEGDDHPGISQRPHKYMKGTFHVGFPQEQLLQRQSPKKTESCLSLLKKWHDGWQLQVPVRKRTPRVPIPALERRFSGMNYAQKSRLSMDGDESAHGTALLLSEPSHQVDSSQVCPTTGRAEDYKQMFSNLVQGKHHGIKINDQSVEGSSDSKGAINVDNSVRLSYAEHKKEKKLKKPKDGNQRKFHDIPEAYSDLNRRLSVDPLLGRLSFEATKAKVKGSSLQAQRKRSKKLFTEDENLACDALHALADLSLALTSSAAEPVESSRESANGGEITVDSTAVSDATLVNMSANEGSKKKKLKTLKIQTGEKQSESQFRTLTEEKALVEEDTKSKVMFKEHNEACLDTKHSKSTRSSVVTSIIDQEMAETDVAVSSRQHLGTDQVVLPAERKIQRKRKRPWITNGVEGVCSSRGLLNNKSAMLPGTVPCVKEKLSSSLSSPLLRRWCGFEWFYSAVDYPWFAKKEFVEYLNHVGLGHIPRLTRVEWGVIRSSLGKPRRFSRYFLQEEREKLEQYRESVRTHYSELRAGLREGLPTDLARPLSVGQRVIAIHPKTREFHDGNILTVDHDKFRVQFDRPELGVEFVTDINCMPCNQLENMPEVMRRQKFSIDCANSNGQITDGQPMLAFSSLNSWPVTSVDSMSSNPDSKEGANKFLKMPSVMQVEASAYQVRPADGVGKHSVHLNNSLAREVSPYLYRPKQERFPGNFVNSSYSRSYVGGTGVIPLYVDDCEDSASKVAEIVRGSREKAHKMVDAAIQAISFLKEGDAYATIGEALESISDVHSPSESSGLPPIPSQSVTNGSLNDQNEMKVNSSQQPLTNCAGDNTSEAKELKFPSELITSCVATLLMIQKCTDRQYPPAEVAHILDNAVTSMQPCCPQNLTVYREIEMCMGRIKTQILALIPS